MKQHMTLQELAAKLTADQKANKDYVADTRKIRMTMQGNICLMDDRGGIRLRPTRHFHRQLAQYVKVPQLYYDRCLESNPELVARQVNHWLDKDPKKRLVRCHNDRARAFMSNRYRPLDNFDLAQAILPVIGQRPHAKVEACSVTPTSFQLKVLTEDIRGEVEVGDPCCVGLTIRNSEIGLGGLSVWPTLYRYACKNGLILPELGAKKTHLGRDLSGEVGEDGYQWIRDETRKLDDKAFFSKVTDLVTGVLQQATMEKMIRMTRKTVDCVVVDPVEAVNHVSSAYSLNESEATSVLTHLSAGGKLTGWGLVNAVTAAAQDAETFERSTEMEQIGGRLANDLAGAQPGLATRPGIQKLATARTIAN